VDQEAKKNHGIPVSSTFDKCSTAAEMVARATRRDETPVASPPTPRDSNVFSQNYDEGVSLFSAHNNNNGDNGGSSGAVAASGDDEMKNEVNENEENSSSSSTHQGEQHDPSASMDSELMLSMNPSPIKNNWLPDLLLLIAQSGYDKCFREISQCVAMLLIDINAPAPIPIKD
jgi:hypothetical protein